MQHGESQAMTYSSIKSETTYLNEVLETISAINLSASKPLIEVTSVVGEGGFCLIVLGIQARHVHDATIALNLLRSARYDAVVLLSDFLQNQAILLDNN